MNDTPTRRKQVDFVDYLKVGQSFIVKAGNPEHITSLAGLSGKSVSVEFGTTNSDFLDAADRRSSRRPARRRSTIKTFPKDTDAASALKAGRVDAYFGDSPVVAYYALEGQVVRGRRFADRADRDRDRDPQGRPAEGGDPEGDRPRSTRTAR